MKNRFIFFVLLLAMTQISTQLAIAQDSVRVVPPSSLAGQYSRMLGEARSYPGLKLISVGKLSNFWRNVSDSLSKERRQLTNIKSSISGHNREVASLQSQIKAKENELQASKNKVDEVNFLGIKTTRSTYYAILWATIILLGLALTFIIFQSSKYRREARYRVKLFEEVSDEFQHYKVKANEKEKKLARELQTERNRVEELLGRG